MTKLSSLFLAALAATILSYEDITVVGKTTPVSTGSPVSSGGGSPVSSGGSASPSSTTGPYKGVCSNGNSPSTTLNAKGIFPLSSLDKTLLDPICNGKVNNDNFHPCPLQGACSFCNSTCTPKTPGSCSKQGDSSKAECKTGYGCGSPVIIKWAQGNINSCNTGPGFGSAQGNTNSVSNAQSNYYCAATSATASQCCKLCDDFKTKGPDGNPSFRCGGWLLINPNTATENSGCSTTKGPGNKWVEQGGENQYVLAPYYGGCGWCFLMPQGECTPTCSSWGLCADNSDSKNNIYWALYGRQTCSYGKNDPHFTGADGTRFEFNGVPSKTFCLVSDNDVHVNMKMHGYYDTRTVGASIVQDGKALRTWIREFGIVWRKADAEGRMHQYTLHLAARSGPAVAREEKGFLAKAALNGKPISGMSEGSSVVNEGSGLSFTFVGVEKKGKFETERYRVVIDGLLDLSLRLRVAHPLLQTPEDAEVHFNVVVDSLAPTSAVHGVLGQTFRSGRAGRALKYSTLGQLLGHPVAADGESGMGYLDGTTEDYVSSSILSTDCAFSAFAKTDYQTWDN